MSIPLSFGSNNIQVYAYEGFDYTIVNPPGTTVSSLSNSSGLEPRTLYFSNDASGNTRFSVTDTQSTLIASSRPETFTVTAANGAVSSNSVTINPGRFLDPSRNTFVGNSYTFYKSEAISSTLGKPFRLVAPSFELKQPTSIPTLPPGLSFVKVDSNIYDISGIPLVVVPNSNYQIIGVQQGGSKVVTTRFNMAISNERVQINAVNPLITNMQIGVPVTPCVITSVPPIGTSLLRYTFSSFPDGIVARDISGTVRTSPVDISDSPYTLTIGGTPTSNAAYAFRFDPSGMVYPIVASRIVPAPLVQSNTTVRFTFDETVLFDLSSVPQLYVDVPLDPSAIFFRAQTYYPISNNIASITAASLPSGLSLNYTAGSDRAYLTGTPSSAGSGNYTLQATNSNGKTQTYTVPISVTQDVVSFLTPPTPVDVCYNFVISRPSSSALTGYYPSNIQFVAQAGSKLPVTLSAPALAGTGLSLDSNGFIVGIPTSVKSLGDLTVTANVIGSPATASTTVKFAILNDQFFFADVCANNFNFVENVAITPFQIPVTTLSGRNVTDFAQSGFPTGISINPAGLVSGTALASSPTAGNVTIVPTTGFASTPRDFSFNLTPDSILFTVPQDSYSYIAGQTVNIPVTGTSYSGTSVRNFALTLPSSYGLNIDANTGLMGGMWTNSIPPNQVLPSSCNFDVTAKAGNLNGILPVSFTAIPALQNTSFVWQQQKLFRYNDVSWSEISGLSNLSNTFDIVIKNTKVDGNVIMGTAANTIVRSVNAVDFSMDVMSSSEIFSELAFDPASTDWWASGTAPLFGGSNVARISKSDDNGLSWSNFSVLSNTIGQFILSRNSNLLSGSSPYLIGGVALAYKDGVMLAGGLSSNMVSSPSMLRSTNGGVTWNNPVGGFRSETAYINTDDPTIWVATGSDAYKTLSPTLPSYFSMTPNKTIKYSPNQGNTWIDAANGFTMFGYELIYANNTWVATGVDGLSATSFAIKMKYSTDGSNWSDATPFATDPFSNLSPFPTPPLPLGSMNYDGSKWNVFVQIDLSSTKIYSSSDISAPASSWTITDVTSTFGSSGRLVSYTRPQWLRVSKSRIIDILLSFNTGIGNGPVIDLPSDSLLLYQYVPVSIDVASSEANVIFFIADEDLPPGLDFNPLTNKITGKPAQTGTFQTEVYAKYTNAAGVTRKVITFTVNIPRVIRKQDGAGAYTSLLKQYTEVLAAQSARDNRALPSQEKRLGEFMSTVPTAVTTAVLPKACLVCRRVECPTVTKQSVDAGEVVTTVCDFIDANSGDIFDAGNADANVCE